VARLVFLHGPGAGACDTFRSGDLRIHYLDWGNDRATPLLLLHHISINAHTWDFFARSVCGTYRVLAMDMRGHGRRHR
jgi:pimeloyl-ACP methyl ester carboxylesterase